MKKLQTLLSVTAAVAIMAMTGAGADAQTASPKKVRMVVGTSTINIGYPAITLPAALGYWKDEGLDVEVIPAGASLQAFQQLVAANAEIYHGTSAVVVQGVVKNRLPVKIAAVTGIMDWSIAVKSDSTLTDVKQFKGKTIGVFSLASGGIALLEAYLRENGMDPKTDISLVALGMGAAPVEALSSGKVDGLLYWDAAVAGFENAGLKLRKIADKKWRTYPDYTVAVSNATVAANPDMVIGVARGMMKALTFATANPECALKLHWKNFPDTKPTNVSETTAHAWDMNYLTTHLNMVTEAFQLNGGVRWGNVETAPYDGLQQFMKTAGQIDSVVASSVLLAGIENLSARVNDFDKNAIVERAKKCDF